MLHSLTFAKLGHLCQWPSDNGIGTKVLLISEKAFDVLTLHDAQSLRTKRADDVHDKHMYQTLKVYTYLNWWLKYSLKFLIHFTVCRF